MTQNEMKLLSWLTRYGMIASEYKAWLDKKGIAPKGKIFTQALAGLIAFEG